MKNTHRKKFPENFLWGGAFAACQTEGAYNEGEKVYLLQMYTYIRKI